MKRYRIRMLTGDRVRVEVSPTTSTGDALSTASPSRKTPLRAAVGDTVVFAGHGVGLVVALEQKRVGDTERDCLVVDLADGLRITLPLEEAADRFRAVAGKREFEDVRTTLASPTAERDEPWTKRIKESKAKLAAAGRPIWQRSCATATVLESRRAGRGCQTGSGASTSRLERSSCASCAQPAG